MLEELKKLPNQITGFRLAVLPLLYYFAITGNPILFSVLFVMAGLSDTLDGWVARKFDMCSEFGSNFDQYVDDAVLLSGIVFMFFLRSDIYSEQILWLWALIIMYVINRVIINLKFNWKTRLHLYSGKIFERSFYFIVTILIFVKNYYPFFYLLMIIGFYAIIEELLIYLTSEKLDTKIRTLWGSLNAR